MVSPFVRGALLSILVAASACGSLDPTSHWLAAVRENLHAVRAEVARHQAVCSSATALAEATADAEHHGQEMGLLLNELDTNMTPIGRCSGPGVARLQDALGTLRNEMTMHTTQLQSVTSLDQAHASCSDYASAMNQLLDGAIGDFSDLGCWQM